MFNDSKVTFELSTSIWEPTKFLNKVERATTLEGLRPAFLSSLQLCTSPHCATDPCEGDNILTAPQILRMLHDNVDLRRLLELVHFPENLVVLSY